jgi:hypothetical protein
VSVPGDDAYHQRLLSIDFDEERRLLEGILSGGYDQGCFLRPRAEDLLGFSPDHTEHVMAAAEQRAGCRARESASPADTYSYRPIDSTEPGFVIVSQRCDLLAALRDEPFVELVAARAVDAESSEARSARLNSARLILLAEEGERVWVADLRRRLLLAKDRLIAYAPHHAIPAAQRERVRMRLGQRYSRDPLPHHLVVALQRPLIKLLGKNKTTNRQASVFSEWMLHEEQGERYRLIAMVAPNHTSLEGDDAYDALSRLFTEEMNALLDDDSGALAMEELDFRLWSLSLKINLDEISWHGEGDQAEPNR